MKSGETHHKTSYNAKRAASKKRRANCNAYVSKDGKGYKVLWFERPK